MSRPPYKKRAPSNKRGAKPRPGLAARRLAAQWLGLIMQRRRPMDEILAHAAKDKFYLALEPRDRAFARLMLMTALRHHGDLTQLLSNYLQKPPAGKTGVREILMIGAAQLLYMDVPPHAALDLAVADAKSSDKSQHLAKLVNAVLRRISREGADLIAKDKTERNIPAFLSKRWKDHYGEEKTAAMISAMLTEPALDLIVPEDKDDWAKRLDGTPLFHNAIRLTQKGAISELEGYEEGAWWVQDFAAQLPTALMGDVAGLKVADLCAAPGGKTAALAKAGAMVTAVDISSDRLQRLRENLTRLKITDAVEVVAKDVLSLNTPPLANSETQNSEDRFSAAFDAVLLDAPCSATGTIRRHPDILITKTEPMIKELASLQKAMLKKAIDLVKPGGFLIYCTCSLEIEEGEQQIEEFLSQQENIQREPFTKNEVFGQEHWLTPLGDVRLTPEFAAAPEGQAIGMDGFFISRLRLT